MASLGFPIWITSARRSPRQQAKLYAEWLAGRRKLPAQPPGKSLHEVGRAFDIGSVGEGLNIAGQIAPFLDLRWGGRFQNPDPVHFER